jgi:hypothetical protein
MNNMKLIHNIISKDQMKQSIPKVLTTITGIKIINIIYSYFLKT